MRIDLTRAWPRACLLTAVILSSAVLTFFSGKAYVAARWQASSDPELWQKAARLEPGNADNWGRVGLSRQWDLSPAELHEAVRDLQKATQVDPRSSDLWMELADAYQTSGDQVHAEEAYEKAKSNYPMSSEVAWRYGSFLLYEGKFFAGYREIQRAITTDSSLTQRAIEECWQSNPSVAAITDSVLPAKSEYYLEAIDYFVSRKLPGPALAIWNRQLELGLAINLPNIFPLIDMLIDEDRMPEAQQTWQQALDAANWPRDASNTRSLIFNGQFVQDILNGGFDWRETAVAGIHFSLDSCTHTGPCSFRVQFDGRENLDFQNVFQYVPVQSNAIYHFSAYMRTEEISTDSGLRFEILDARHPSQLQIVTSSVTGTNPWTQVQADVRTGYDTDLLKITLRRIPSWKFDNKLSGTAWVSDITLTPVKELPRDNSG